MRPWELAAAVACTQAAAGREVGVSSHHCEFTAAFIAADSAANHVVCAVWGHDGNPEPLGVWSLLRLGFGIFCD